MCIGAMAADGRLAAEQTAGEMQMALGRGPRSGDWSVERLHWMQHEFNISRSALCACYEGRGHGIPRGGHGVRSRPPQRHLSHHSRPAQPQSVQQACWFSLSIKFCRTASLRWFRRVQQMRRGLQDDYKTATRRLQDDYKTS